MQFYIILYYHITWKCVCVCVCVCVCDCPFEIFEGLIFCARSRFFFLSFSLFCFFFFISFSLLSSSFPLSLPLFVFSLRLSSRVSRICARAHPGIPHSSK